MLPLNPCITAAVVCVALSVNAAPQKQSGAKTNDAQRKVEAAQPPPLPPTPEQMPAVQPRVSLQNGLLSIDAPNSNMTDVLNAVRRQTGATIEVPPGSGSDRIVARIGPGKPKDVLASLLSGSRFNFIILGPPQNPDGIQKVILTRRQAGAAASSGTAGQPSFNPQVVPAPEEETFEESEPEPPPEEIAQPEIVAPTAQPGQDPSQQPQPQQGQSPNQTKTPEQLLQELQRMQQQQQQQPQGEPNQQQADPAQQPQQQFPPDRNPSEE